MLRGVSQFLVLFIFFLILRSISPPLHFLCIPPPPWLQYLCSSIHAFFHLLYLFFISIVLVLVVLLLYLHHSSSYYPPPPQILSPYHPKAVSVTTTSVASTCPPLPTNFNQQEPLLHSVGAYPCFSSHGNRERRNSISANPFLCFHGKDDRQPQLMMKKCGNTYSHEHHRNSIYANPRLCFRGKHESRLQQQKGTRNHFDHGVTSANTASRSLSRSRVYEHAPSEHYLHPSAANRNNIDDDILQYIPRKNRSYSRNQIDSAEVYEYRHIFYDDGPVKSITDSSVNHSSSLERAKQQHNMLPSKSAHPKKPLFVAQRESFQGGRPVIKAPEHYAGDFGEYQDADNSRCVDGTARTRSSNISAGNRTASRSRSSTTDNGLMGTIANSDVRVSRSSSDGKHGSEHREGNRWAEASERGESGNRTSGEGDEREKTRRADGKEGKGKMERGKSGGRGYDPRQDVAEKGVARSYGEGNKSNPNAKNVVDDDDDDDGHHGNDSMEVEKEQRKKEEMEDKICTDFIASVHARRRAEEL